jgi:gas vesicle protein
MAQDDGGAGTVVVAFVLGAITGAAVALLMAPASGEETRRRLADKAREGADRAGEAARQGRELWNRQRDTLNNAFERGRDAYEQARGGTQPPGTQPPANPSPGGM